jgi:hypothetical protein
MKRTLAFAAGAAALLGMAGLAIAEPAYGPNAVYYYPNYAPPPPAVYAPPPTVYVQPSWDDTHTGGGASRAYPYGGGPKPN